MISVYIPFKESQESLLQVVQAVLSQSMEFSELLLIDDGSSTEWYKNILPNDSRIRVIRHTKNQGVAAARNTAIRESNCEILVGFDSDVVPRVDCLINMISILYSDQKVAGVGGRVTERFTDNPSDLFRSIFMRQDRGIHKINGCDLFGGCTVYRKSALEQVGGYLEILTQSFEDFDISRRIRDIGYSTFYTPTARAEHIKKDTIQSCIDTMYRWSYPHWEEKSIYTTNDWLKNKLEFPTNMYESEVSKDSSKLSYKLQLDLQQAKSRLRDRSNRYDELLFIHLLYPIRSFLHDIYWYKHFNTDKGKVIEDSGLDAINMAIGLTLSPQHCAWVIDKSKDLLEKLNVDHTKAATHTLVQILSGDSEDLEPARIFLESTSDIIVEISSDRKAFDKSWSAVNSLK